MPTVVVTTTKFAHLTRVAAQSFALPDPRIAVIGHPIGDTPADTLQAWADAAVEDVVACFCGQRGRGLRS